MANAPKRADESGLLDAALTANDGGDGDDVIGISRMAHSKKKAKHNDGQKSEHWMIKRLSRRESGCAAFRESRGIRPCLGPSSKKPSKRAFPGERPGYWCWRLAH